MFDTVVRERDGAVVTIDDLDALASPPPGPPSVNAVSAAIDEAVALQAEIDALEGRKLLALEKARRAAMRCERDLLAQDDPELARAGTSRRHQLALRAFVADVAAALRLSERQAGHLVDTARTLTAHGRATLAALCRGEFSAAIATAMADTLADVPDGRARAEVQAEALTCARAATPSAFRRHLRRARDRVHPEPMDVRHERASAKRAVHVDPGADGMAWLTAYLPATTAHAIADRLDATARQARTAGDGRTLDQLRADALAALLLVGVPTAGDGAGTLARELESGLVPDLADQARRITPRVSVTVPVLALLGRTDVPAELEGHGPVDPATAAVLAAGAPSLRRLLVDPVSGRVLTTDAGTYTVPAALRAYLQARDGTCRFPGCSRPARASDVDHTTAWAAGGTTTAANLAHLCRRHHVLKHQTRWHARQLPDGTLRWTSPAGRTYHDAVAPPVDTSGELLRDPGPPPF
ncbi:HNH endonuclease signature motif containing protein [Isoptericola variabilis]|uniref:HNH endonuclease n=1 Tax=Isoptericola variabilis (strain 225) TaxID=743718 RepID=F6FWA6_ISOV2|nr:HNH endonuclease signature motif containing protein [Isoptericola variabilis]AEG45650.1 HNH endonuclease [Isoptericola variabilis 225]TWH28812.1 HNH endonuclease [Isoptericola variabilis J7]